METENRRFSILLPLSGNVASAANAVDAVLAQRYDDLELLVAADAADSGAAAWLQARAAGHDGALRLQVTPCPAGMGLAERTERLLALSTGGCIGVFGGDAVLADATVLSTAAAALASCPEAGVVLPWPGDAPDANALKSTLACRPLPAAPGAFYRREACLRVAGLAQKYHDLWTWPAQLILAREGVPFLALGRAGFLSVPHGRPRPAADAPDAQGRLLTDLMHLYDYEIAPYDGRFDEQSAARAKRQRRAWGARARRLARRQAARAVPAGGAGAAADTAAARSGANTAGPLQSRIVIIPETAKPQAVLQHIRLLLRRRRPMELLLAFLVPQPDNELAADLITLLNRQRPDALMRTVIFSNQDREDAARYLEHVLQAAAGVPTVQIVHAPDAGLCWPRPRAAQAELARFLRRRQRAQSRRGRTRAKLCRLVDAATVPPRLLLYLTGSGLAHLMGLLCGQVPGRSAAGLAWFFAGAAVALLLVFLLACLYRLLRTALNLQTIFR